MRILVWTLLILAACAERIDRHADMPDTPPAIARTASMSVIVSDTSAAVEQIAVAAEQSGGYVSELTVWREGDVVRGTMSVRVPSAELTKAMAAVRRVAKRVDAESIRTRA